MGRCVNKFSHQELDKTETQIDAKIITRKTPTKSGGVRNNSHVADDTKKTEREGLEKHFVDPEKLQDYGASGAP